MTQQTPVDQLRQAITTAFIPIEQQNEMGTLIRAKALNKETIKRVCFQPLPETAWYVQIHVILPYEHVVNAIVTLRDGEMKNECHLGYELEP